MFRGHGIGRRSAVLGAAALLAGAGVRGRPARGAGSLGAVVQTREGRVRGALADAVHVFKGIPYGASTAGPNRFMPPRRRARWSGVRDALDYGPIAIDPTGTDNLYAQVLRGLYPQALIGAVPGRGMSEDCLHLNVWSPELGRSAKRPVMVWLLPWAGYSQSAEGANLAKRGDVVVVSVGHRTSFGHLYLGDLAGPKYAQSGNAGLLDIIAALSWVQENIAQFGGDPDNVTIFGESAASALITVLLAMPPAKGLFHKAILESTVYIRAMPREFATAATCGVMKRLGLGPKDAERLHDLPPALLLSAMEGSVFTAVVDGVSLPRHPFDPDAPPTAADVPILIGTNKDEGTYHSLRTPLPEPLQEQDLARSLVARFPHLGVADDGQAALLVAAYRELFPASSPREAFHGIGTCLVQDNAFAAVEKTLARGGAPLYMYLFAWEAPAFGGRYGASHTFEIPFVFDNLDTAAQLFGSGPGPREYELAARICRAWAAFAHKADPGHSGLPPWKPYALNDRTTMVLNYECATVSDPRQAERLAFETFRASRVANIFPENCRRPRAWNCEKTWQ